MDIFEELKNKKDCHTSYIPEKITRDDVEKIKNNLRWDSHKGHCELLKEFYYFNKYLITEQLKDALLDAIECMECTMTEEGEIYKEEGKKNIIW